MSKEEKQTVYCNCNAPEPFHKMYSKWINTGLRIWKYTDTRCYKCRMFEWYIVEPFDFFNQNKENFHV